MFKFLIAALLMAQANHSTVVRRIYVHRADPYLVAGILKGQPPQQPETSTQLGGR